MTDSQLSAIDLFAGGGALTVGLKSSGFRVLSAVEIEQAPYATYHLNHPEVRAYKHDVRELSGADLLAHEPGVELDLIAGCPPCQGFTSLTSKWKRSDPRNELIDEMARFARELQPRAIMMENVPRLASTGKHLLARLVDDLKSMGYMVTCEVLRTADYGTPQSRKRLVLLAGKGFSIPVPPPSHSRDGENGLPKWRSVRDVLGELSEPVIFSGKKRSFGDVVNDWHVVRNMSPANVERLRHTKPGEPRTHLPMELRPPCHRNDGKGFSNVYGRMQWDALAPTITSGCTVLSKGRFGHPEQLRTISVREAALLQEFPETYRLGTTYIDEVCDIIGNALPCGFAEAMARQVHSQLVSTAV